MSRFQPNPMLDELDHLLRDLLPRFLEAAGMGSSASAVRRVPRLSTAQACRTAIGLMNHIGSAPAAAVKDPEWGESASCVAFWMGAAVWAAANNDRVTCLRCVLFLKRGMDSMWPKVALH